MGDRDSNSLPQSSMRPSGKGRASCLSEPLLTLTVRKWDQFGTLEHMRDILNVPGIQIKVIESRMIRYGWTPFQPRLPAKVHTTLSFLTTGNVVMRFREPHRAAFSTRTPVSVQLLGKATLSLFSASNAACSVPDIVGSSSQESKSVMAGIDRTYNFMLLNKLGRFPSMAVQVSGDPLSTSNGNDDKKHSWPDKVHADS